MSREMQIDYCRWYHPDLVPKHHELSYWVIVHIENEKGVIPGFATPCLWVPKERVFRQISTHVKIAPRLVMVLPKNDTFYPTLEP